jgi:hypothetical protein
LCYKCNAKWSKDHRCAPKILHEVEAIWGSFSSDDSLANSDTDSPDFEQVFLTISKSTLLGTPTARIVCLLGHIQQIPVHVLIDSGSSSYFINETLVHQLQGMPTQLSSIAVQVAGGGVLHSSCVLQQVPWTVVDCTFKSDLRVLSLGKFDVAIGMVWLEAHSPIMIDWRQKELTIPYQGSYKLL